MTRVAGLVALILGLIMVAPTATSSDADDDWWLVKITAGPQGAADVKWGMYGLWARTGEQQYSGKGTGGDRLDGSMYIRGDGGGTRVMTTEDAGGIEVVLVEDDRAGLWRSSSAGYSVQSMAPGETVAALWFEIGSEVLDFKTHNPSFESGSVELELITGSGSTALIGSDPSASGVAVGVGGISAGGARHEHAVEWGLAGGATYAGNYCQVCEVHWWSPDGRSGAWTTFTHSDLVFAGPGGEWSWEWRGLGANQPMNPQAFAAWAPVGEDWTLFTVKP